MESIEADEKIIDLSGQGIKKIPRNIVNEKTAHCLEVYLNNNDIQKLEFLSGFQSIEKFMASHNQLLRMYGVQSFKNLVYLDLSYNKIICIEGLRELTHLLYLNLAHNKIKDIDHTLQKNARLEYLDLSDNIISNISNLSHLIKLKSLLFHGNQITNLRHCELYLPKSLEKLTLAKNKITDLNEVCHLVELVNLKEISLAENPCVECTGNNIGVDYRPFLVNWCVGLKVIDAYAVSDMECLKGEWLYSQGKGRKFRPGEHKELVQYLAENVPFTGDLLDSEQDRKLRLILSKAREHKSPLNPQLGSGKVVSRVTPQIMTRSLDPSLFGKTNEQQSNDGNLLSRSLHCTSLTAEKEPVSDDVAEPLPAASKLVPVPESLVSPMVANIPDIPLISSKDSSSYPSNEMQSTTKLIMPNEEPRPPVLDKIKLQAIRNIAEEMKVKKTSALDRGDISHEFLLYLESNSTEPLFSSPTPPQEFFKPEPIKSRTNAGEIDCPQYAFKHHVINKDDLFNVNEVSRLIDFIEIIDPKGGRSSSDTNSVKSKKSGDSHSLSGSSSTTSMASHRTLPTSFKIESDEAPIVSCEHNTPEETRQHFKRESAVKNVVTELVEQIGMRYNRSHFSNRHDNAAARIQKVWRGYRARCQQPNVHSLVNSMELRRVHEHVVKLAGDVEGVKIALENEHKVHVLQIQAINGLWRKLNAMQTVHVDEPPPEIKDISETCERLNARVEQLQLCMQEVMKYMGRCVSPSGSCVSTQTEITAVHTPSDETTFLYNRPSSLPLTAHHVSQYAENLVGDALKDTVTVPTEDCDV